MKIIVGSVSVDGRSLMNCLALKNIFHDFLKILNERRGFEILKFLFFTQIQMCRFRQKFKKILAENQALQKKNSTDTIYCNRLYC